MTKLPFRRVAALTALAVSTISAYCAPAQESVGLPAPSEAGISTAAALKTKPKSPKKAKTKAKQPSRAALKDSLRKTLENPALEGSYSQNEAPKNCTDSICMDDLVKIHENSIATAREEARERLRRTVFPAGTPDLPRNEDGTKYLSSPLPAEWEYCETFLQTLPADDEWWQRFDDPSLTELITRAETDNHNLRAAYHRIQAAKALLKQTRAGYYPTIGFAGGYYRERSSGRTGLTPGDVSYDDYLNLGLSLSWEIDLFGRIRANSKAAISDLNVTRAEFVGTQIALSANVAKAYINVRLAQAQLAIAQQHLESQGKVVKITEARRECGLGTKLDVYQAEQVYMATKATLPGLEAQVTTGINALALLCGCYAEDISHHFQTTTPLPILLHSPETGVPADLLRRRPDVIQAEQQLAAAAARVGVAKKDFLPTLSLDASVGTQAHRPGDLFTDPSFAYIISPKLSWTIFDGLARNAATQQAKEAMEEQIENYNQTVQQAVLEVNTDIANLCSSVETIREHLELLSKSSETLDLALDLYKRGLTQFTNVVNAQMSMLNEENELVASKAQSLIDAIELYEALGGGY